MIQTIKNLPTNYCIHGRHICNLRFADDIDLIASGESELQELATRLGKDANTFGMEISTEKNKV